MTTTPQTPPPQTEPPAAVSPSNLEPRTPNLSLKLLTLLISIPLMSLATGFFGSLSLICGLWDRSGRQQHAIARLWGRTLLALSFSPVRVLGADILQSAPVAVYASNHLSYMDTPTLFASLPFQFRILAKAGLWKIPFVGWHLRRSGQVPIDAGSPRSAIAGLLRGVAALKSGMPLFVFPEGARSPDGHLHAPASGCAFMAIRAQVPLVPLALIGTYELLPIHVYTLRPRPLMLIAGDPIPTTGLTTRDADDLAARLYTEIGKMYYAHSDLTPAAPTPTELSS